MICNNSVTSILSLFKNHNRKRAILVEGTTYYFGGNIPSGNYDSKPNSAYTTAKYWDLGRSLKDHHFLILFQETSRRSA